MKRTTWFLLAMTVMAALFVSACGGAAQAPAPQQQQQPQQPAAPAQQQQQQPAAPAQSFAPACQASASCSAPAVKDTEASSTYCVQKIPYQNIAVEPGTTFEALDPKGELKCSDSGTVVDGKKIITCTGKQLWTYELKLTNSSCGGGGALTADATKCQEGLGYDAAQNCCAPLKADSGGSVTIKVNVGACPLPQ